MTAVLLTPPVLQFFGSDGVTPLASGKVYTYTSTGGTFATLKATYTNAAGTIEAPNPIVLNSRGIPATGNGGIWITGTYDFKITDSNDSTVDTQLAVTAFSALAASSTAYFESFSGTGAQTAFTTSTSLGTDEKAIYVWVDAGAGKGYEIYNPNAYTISGTTLTFSVAPASGTNNIYVSAPSSLIGAASSSAAAAAASEAAAAASASAASTSATAAAASAASLYGTSTTSLSITVASKTFTTQSGKLFAAGSFLVATSDADPTNYMHGQVTSYSGTTLVLNVTNIGGSGTLADWTIRVSGTRGVKGDTGSISDLSGVPSGTVANNDKLIFQDVSDSNITKSCLVSDVSSTVLLQTQTASAAASVAFSSTYLTNSYSKYIVEFSNAYGSAASANLLLKVSTDNGSTYIGGSSHSWQGYYQTSGSPTVSGLGASSQASIDISLNGTTFLSSPYANGTIKVVIGSDGFSARYDWGYNDRGFIVNGKGGCNTTAVNNFKLYLDSGNISGTFKLYGVL